MEIIRGKDGQPDWIKTLHNGYQDVKLKIAYWKGETEIDPDETPALKKLVRQLKRLRKDNDTERAHADADSLLLEYINNPKVNKAYESITRWYA